MKNIFCLLAGFLMISVLFISCAASVSPENTVSEIAVQEMVEIPTISLSFLSEYTLIRPEDAAKTVITAASALYSELRELNPDLAFKDDYYREDLPDYAMRDFEILIGETNRPESIEFIDSLRTKDYGYVMQDRKIIIAGKSDEYTVKAVELFTREIVNRKNTDDIFYSAEDDLLKTGEYPLNSLSVRKNSEETPIQEFTIIYPEEGEAYEYLCAELLASVIANTTGYCLNIRSDREEPLAYEILIGKTNRSESEIDLAENVFSMLKTLCKNYREQVAA